MPPTLREMPEDDVKAVGELSNLGGREEQRQRIVAAQTTGGELAEDDRHRGGAPYAFLVHHGKTRRRKNTPPAFVLNARRLTERQEVARADQLDTAPVASHEVARKQAVENEQPEYGVSHDRVAAMAPPSGLEPPHRRDEHALRGAEPVRRKPAAEVGILLEEPRRASRPRDRPPPPLMPACSHLFHPSRRDASPFQAPRLG